MIIYYNIFTLPIFNRLEGRESHKILVSAPFNSSSKGDVLGCEFSSTPAEAGTLDLLDVLTGILAGRLALLCLVELELSSELSYLTERTGETCLYKNDKKDLYQVEIAQQNFTYIAWRLM